MWGCLALAFVVGALVGAWCALAWALAEFNELAAETADAQGLRG